MCLCPCAVSTCEWGNLIAGGKRYLADYTDSASYIFSNDGMNRSEYGGNAHIGVQVVVRVNVGHRIDAGFRLHANYETNVSETQHNEPH